MSKGINKDREAEMYLSGMSIPEVSEHTGVPLSTLRFRFKKKGILRSRGDGVRMAAQRGRISSALRGKKRPPRSAEWSEKIAASNRGNGVGLSRKPNGYIVIMEQIIGRRLAADECVHHKNGLRGDNRPENLELMTRSEHSAHHARELITSRKRDEMGRLI